MFKNQRGVAHPFFLLIIVIVLGVVGLAGWQVYKKNLAPLPNKSASGATVNYDQEVSRQLTDGHCNGAGPVSIGPPMPLDQVSFILPYGLVTGGHVTPVDHQYYNGLLANKALRDTYDVIAPADGTLISIQHRGMNVNTPPHTVNNPSSDEYRLTIVHTCSFITTLDLQTGLSDNIKAQLPKDFDPVKGWSGQIKVTKGELLGHIGGQTLDFFVWDLSHKLTGFINPDQYTKAEDWKLFTAPVSEYYDKSIKDQVIAKYVRTAEPIDGKIDYDIDGKLIGNWFLQGSGGYPGKTGRPDPNYFVGHLSFAPDFIDPSVFNISIGNYGTYKPPTASNQDFASVENSGAAQFMTLANAPDPAKVGQPTGLVKYELVQKQYLKPDGSQWDNSSFVRGLKAAPLGGVQATALVQLTDKRTLKFEIFRGLKATQVQGFDSGAQTYVR